MELNTTNQIIPFIKQKHANIAERFPFFNSCALQSPVHVAWKVNLVQLYPLPSLFPLFLVSLPNQKTKNMKQKSQHNAPQNYFVNWKMGNTIQL